MILGAIAKAICVVRPEDLTLVYANRTFERSSVTPRRR